MSSSGAVHRVSARFEPPPRRAPDPGSGGNRTPARVRSLDLPAAPFLLLCRRLLAWSGALLGARFAALSLPGRRVDRLTGVHRLRATLERMGGSAIKIGQQVALRLDILPLDACNELGRLHDHGPLLDIDYVIDRVESACGLALADCFETFDPQPIVADCTSCVYQAVLRSGERVAVKVRRPGILRDVATDLRALGLLLGTLEFLTLVRPGTYTSIEAELRQKLAEELDYVLAARYQALFRRRCRRAGLKFVTAARVHPGLGAADVMVSEFVPGVWLHEVIDARRGLHQSGPGLLAEHDIDPAAVARRLLQAMWWAQFEMPFFPVEPRAGNIIVQPGDRIVFVNLGECGRTSSSNRDHYREVLLRLSQGDATGASDALLQMLAPLPFVDADEFRTLLERGLWQHLFSLRHRQALPWERTGTRLWVELLQMAHRFGVPVRLRIVRLMRAVLMTDMLASQLRPDLDYMAEFRRYLAQADRRKVEDGLREMELGIRDSGPAAGAVEIARVAEKLRRLRFWVDSRSRFLPLQFMSLSAKGAYVSAVLLQLVSAALAAAVLVFAIGAGGTLLAGTHADPWSHFGGLLRHPLFLALLGVIVLLALRRILFRLGDRDRHD